jgi:hypothetical protein
MPAFVLGATALGAEALASTIVTVPPTVDVTAPTGSVATASVTAAWTYSSGAGRPQLAYRVVLTSSGEVLFDTGRLDGDDATLDIDYVLSPFSSYVLWVGVSDGLDGAEDPYGSNSSWGSTEFSTGALIVSYDPVLSVGRIYEIGINGVGYMLADTAERPIKRQTAHLQADRFATGDTPFSEAVDRYTQASHSDWTDGEGQLFLRRPASSASRYFYSEGVNPFEPGQLSCITAPEQHITDSFATPRAVVASSIMFVQTANGELTAEATPEGAATAFSTGLAGTITDLASDGTNWYATDGATVRRNSSAADPAGNWSTEDVTEIEWIGDRIGAIDSVGENFTTLAADGSEEEAGGIQTFAGQLLRGITGGDGYAWFGVNGADSGHVRAWQLDSGAGTTFIGLSLPQGERVDNLYFYLGNVFVAAYNATSTKIYRCAASEGLLTPELVHQRDSTASPPQVKMAGLDRFVAFSWADMERDGSNGVGVIDLATGGVARWISDASEAAATIVPGVVTWAGDFAFTVGGTGMFGPANNDLTTLPLRAGFLETSVDDLSTTLTKQVVEVGLVTLPLSGSVVLSVSDNSNASFVEVGTMSGLGVTTRTFTLERQLKSFGWRVDLTPSDTTGPTVTLITAKLHAMGLIDQIVTVPVKCSDRVKGLNGAELPEAKPGLAMVQTRTLEGLVGDMVTFQDVDWQSTMTSYQCMMISAEVVEMHGAFDVNLGKRVNQAVVAVTLRRSMG